MLGDCINTCLTNVNVVDDTLGREGLYEVGIQTLT